MPPRCLPCRIGARRQMHCHGLAGSACPRAGAQPECASRKKPTDSRERVFFIRPQALEAPSKNALPYDGWSSGPIIYAYVGGNPLSYVDPLGLSALGDAGAFIGGWGGRVGGGVAGEAVWPAGGGIPGAVLGGRLGSLGGRAVGEWLNGIINSQSKTPNSGTPGSCHVNPGSGQERQYGADGLPDSDIDWDHDHGQGVPHGHNWDRGPNGEPIRGPGVPISPWPRGRGPGG
jgi:hypothetical protein